MRCLPFLPSLLLCLATIAVRPALGADELSVEPTYLKNAHPVTSGFAKAGEGYFSPDGKSIIYQAISEDYPFYRIYTQSLAGGEPRLVSTGKGRTTCSNFSPDGKRIIFASSHLDPKLTETEAAAKKQAEEDKKNPGKRRYMWDFDPFMDIFEADLEGHILRQLTNTPGYDAEGAFSRDGKQIAFCSERDGDKEIYVMDADGSNPRRLTHSPGYDGGPFISPDGKWVIFRSDRKKADMLQIYVIGIDGKHEAALTDNGGVNWGPYWHPSKPWLIWASADHSNPNVRPNYDLWLARYEVKDGNFGFVGKPRRVTDNPGADLLPVFSPDGTKLMWTSTRGADHSSQLWMADFLLPQEE